MKHFIIKQYSAILAKGNSYTGDEVWSKADIFTQVWQSEWDTWKIDEIWSEDHINRKGCHTFAKDMSNDFHYVTCQKQ